jgi:2-oxoglutarate ferredoxin oxidoreductase subunit gamma
MQVEVMFTGVGGQGIQLASKTLALGAVIDGRQAMMCGHYAGAMRGGQTDASVVVADEGLRALPILPSAWSALVMSQEYWEPTRVRIRTGGVVVVNGDLVPADFPHDGLTAFRFPAQQLAADAGAPLGGSLVLLGAYCALTGLCSTEALVTAMQRLVPPYRTQHLIGNEAALRAGSAAAPALTAPAWGGRPVLTTSETP